MTYLQLAKQLQVDTNGIIGEWCPGYISEAANIPEFKYIDQCEKEQEFSNAVCLRCWGNEVIDNWLLSYIKKLDCISGDE